MDRHPLSIRDILILTVTALTLLVTMLTARETLQEWQRMERIQLLRQASLLGDRLFNISEKLSLERDIAFFMMQSLDPDTLNSLAKDLKESREETDRSLRPILIAVEGYKFPELQAQVEDSRRKLMKL